MKIEKISENQIKLTLTKADLEKHNIKLDELIKPTDKTQELFKSIMEQAFNECGFEVDNTPLMVEATPVSIDGLMIIVTKLPEKDTHEDKMSLITQNKDLRRYRKKDVSPFSSTGNFDENAVIYSFSCLDDVIDASMRVETKVTGTNMLFGYKHKYYLLIQDSLNDETLSELNEYGEKSNSTALSKYFLIEHGETIVKNPAVKILAESFR
jgi:adapter protein MecA 1/2